MLQISHVYFRNKSTETFVSNKGKQNVSKQPPPELEKKYNHKKPRYALL